MANFAVLIDPDPARRASFIARVTPILPPVEGLVSGACGAGSAQAIWAAAGNAPVSWQADATGLAVLWGNAIGDGGRSDASGLRRLWQDRHAPPPAFDGYHAAVLFDRDAGLVASADVLGFFPVYYRTWGEVAIVASSPEAFRHHPMFAAAVDLEGLVGHLLFSHLLDGRSLFQGVRRLEPGRILRWRPGVSPEEVVQYELPISSRHYDQPFGAHLDLLEGALDHALARQIPDGSPTGLMLSGGLDSRLLAGFLRRRRVSVAALTNGLPSDIEMRCATAVARALGIPHITGESERTVGHADVFLRAEHLAAGFHTFGGWATIPQIRRLPERAVTGLALDAVMGGISVDYCYDGDARALTFERCFAWLNGWGISPERLRRLLRADIFGQAVAERTEQVRSAYRTSGENELQRTWRFYMRHRARFHLGGRAWAHSFASWPVMPVLDRGLLDVAAGLPAATVGERRAQRELLCTRFPALAALPLDRNSWDTKPLRPRLRYQVGRALAARLPAALTARRVWSGGERRRYYRLYDVNEGPWLAVRRAAERCRSHGARFFEPAALSEMLPPPDTVVGQESNAASAGMKMLLGVLLWLDANPA